MLRTLARFDALHKLRLRLGVVVLLGVAGLAVFISEQFGERYTAAYHQAGRDELQAIASTWDEGFRQADLRKAHALGRRIERLRASNGALREVSISWHARGGETLVVRSRAGGVRGSSHDPSSPRRASEAAKPAPIDAADYGYREVHGADGVHYAELRHPIARHGRTVAAMELRRDLEELDRGLARDRRSLAIAGGAAVGGLSLLLNFLLGRAVFAPLQKLRQASRRIGGGEVGTRLDWRRGDEIGELAGDFDRMASELQRVHSHLEGLALKDPLTSLLNHRAFQERAAQELRRAEREGYPVSIVALDVDNFKEINDRWGHAAGDDALRTLASAIRAEIRPSDVCGRVGGDEFMLAIVHSRAEAAEEVVERLRLRIAGMRFGPAGQSLTLSAGVSEFPRHSLSQDELVHLADGAMYWAKSSGRNRSFIYSPDSDFALSAQEAADRMAREGLVNSVHALARAVDAKDAHTHSHSERVANYSAALARHLGLDAHRVDTVRAAALVHDVGKIGIPEVVLLKPGPLGEEELALMRRHSELGHDIIAGAGMREIGRWVLHLHERWDGSGYPHGLHGEEIPLESRVLHVADALEAMTSSRAYRKALTVEAALAELEGHAGGQFDRAVARAMVELVRDGEVEPGEPVAGEADRRPSAPALVFPPASTLTT